MIRMPALACCMLALIVIALGVVACTSLPAAPGGGAGGNAGVGGGTAGAGGSVGTGGDGGVIPSCVTGVPQAYGALEGGDTAEDSYALGKVSGECPSDLQCEGSDPYDQWTFNACPGTQRVELSWDEEVHDLNLFVYAEDQSVDLAAVGAGTEGAVEVILVDLEPTEEQPLIIQVQANGTGGGDAEQSYCLEVIPTGATDDAKRFCRPDR